ncbi:hypothetical protein OSTOST_07467 [Ostertagia ostertagi]
MQDSPNTTATMWLDASQKSNMAESIAERTAEELGAKAIPSEFLSERRPRSEIEIGPIAVKRRTPLLMLFCRRLTRFSAMVSAMFMETWAHYQRDSGLKRTTPMTPTTPTRRRGATGNRPSPGTRKHRC